MDNINNYDLYDLKMTGDQIKAVLNLIHSEKENITALISLKNTLENIVSEYNKEQISGKVIDGGEY